MSTAATHDRFWAKVDASGICWEWTAARAQGYGRFKSRQAHRIAYENLVGPIPAGLQLDHVCRNRACVNPDHLEPVTAAENNRRSSSVSAMNLRKTHCRHGHEFTEENTLVRPGELNARACRRCHSANVTRNQPARRGDKIPCPDCTTPIRRSGMARHRSSHVR